MPPTKLDGFFRPAPARRPEASDLREKLRWYAESQQTMEEDRKQASDDIDSRYTHRDSIVSMAGYRDRIESFRLERAKRGDESVRVIVLRATH